MESKFQETLTLVEKGKLKDFTKGTDGLWRYEGRVCMLTSDDLRRRIMEEEHKSNFMFALMPFRNHSTIVNHIKDQGFDEYQIRVFKLNLVN